MSEMNKTPKEIMQTVCDVLDKKQARNVEVLETGKLTTLADYFIICTATSTTHIKTLSDEVEKTMKEMGEPPLHVEGYRSGGWILMDLGCVIVHIFLEETRQFYSMERLWGDARTVELEDR